MLGYIIPGTFLAICAAIGLQVSIGNAREARLERYYNRKDLAQGHRPRYMKRYMDDLRVNPNWALQWQPHDPWACRAKQEHDHKMYVWRARVAEVGWEHALLHELPL